MIYINLQNFHVTYSCGWDKGMERKTLSLFTRTTSLLTGQKRSSFLHFSLYFLKCYFQRSAPDIGNLISYWNVDECYKREIKWEVQWVLIVIWWEVKAVFTEGLSQNMLDVTGCKFWCPTPTEIAFCWQKILKTQTFMLLNQLWNCRQNPESTWQLSWS